MRGQLENPRLLNTLGYDRIDPLLGESLQSIPFLIRGISCTAVCSYQMLTQPKERNRRNYFYSLRRKEPKERRKRGVVVSDTTKVAHPQIK